MNTIANIPERGHWYALRVSYGRELAVKAKLEEEGYPGFVPMKMVRIETNGKVTHEWVPAVGNRSVLKPIVIPDKQMEDFIRICTASNKEVLYLSNPSEKLRNGAKVRVVNGPFTGVVGTVVRIKKSRRIMVEIPGIIAAASAYVPEDDLELVEN